jgi:surfactin synthase thioesterase subunit
MNATAFSPTRSATNIIAANNDNSYRQKWLKGVGARPDATMRLFVFPFAGGDASAFYRWPQWLPDGCELVSVQLPGRGNRRDEPMPATMGEMVRALIHAFSSVLDKPFVFFGYSMGALIAYELLQQCKRLGLAKPALFCAAACSPPHLHHHQWSAMSDREILQVLTDSDSWLQDIPLVQLQENLPLIKKDLLFCQAYTHSVRPLSEPLDCPLVTIAGAQDSIAPASRVLEWWQYTAASCISRCVVGGHFFLFDSVQLPKIMLRELQPLLSLRACA